MDLQSRKTCWKYSLYGSGNVHDKFIFVSFIFIVGVTEQVFVFRFQTLVVTLRRPAAIKITDSKST